MELLQPTTWTEALEAKEAHPEALPLLGGTDVMVEMNFDRKRPEQILDLTRVPELTACASEGGAVRMGAGVTYTRVIEELGAALPGLAMASRMVGSPQIRNRGTVGGNLGSASPAGDALPPLFTSGAEVEVASRGGGSRRLPVAEFILGHRRTALRPDELILAVHLHPADGPQQYAKVGGRNAMVIAVCSVSLALHPARREVAVCCGSVGPTVLRVPAAESFLGGVLEEEGLWERRGELPEAAVERFGALVAEGVSPIDDTRGTARYRRHAVGVLARRTLGWAWEEHRCA